MMGRADEAAEQRLAVVEDEDDAEEEDEDDKVALDTESAVADPVDVGRAQGLPPVSRQHRPLGLTMIIIIGCQQVLCHLIIVGGQLLLPSSAVLLLLLLAPSTSSSSAIQRVCMELSLVRGISRIRP